jgi:hypothetical protein
MSSIFDSLPGMPLPVAEVTDTIAAMWQSESPDGGVAPSEFRASQMNLILHFGRSTSQKEALTQFEIASRFAQRYPCRIIVLCPDLDEADDYQLSAKLYAQCYMGESYNTKTCSETLLLGYSPEHLNHLENQVSTWLESDLPIYIWLHKVHASEMIENFSGILKSCRRLVYDSSLEGDADKSAPWPSYLNVRDLAYSRTLPLRQSIGQFLSAYPPVDLIDGLEGVEIQYAAERVGESHGLLAWHRASLIDCARKTEIKLDDKTFKTRVLEDSTDLELDVNWTYNDSKRFFHWEVKKGINLGDLRANFGKGELTFPFSIKLLEPEMALGEALFF